MQHFSFSPVDTPTGRLTMSIDYFTSAAMTWLEQRPAPAASPQIIMDYVGSQQVQHDPTLCSLRCVCRCLGCLCCFKGSCSTVVRCVLG